MGTQGLILPARVPPPVSRPELQALFDESHGGAGSAAAPVHRLRVQRQSPESFFHAARHVDDAEPRRRRMLLTHEADRHAPALPSAADALQETAELFAAWQVGGFPIPDRATLADLGAATRADLVWMRAHDPDQPPRMAAGAVCSPSAWDPAVKLGCTLAEIHAVVPGLNAGLGPALDTFLHRLRPGAAWCRLNWGLSASPELNQHPARALPRLGCSAQLEDAWLRIEHQALIALPRSASVLFAIHVEVLALTELALDPALAHGLARSLEAMPQSLARYKGLEQARSSLVSALTPPRAGTQHQKQY